MKVNVWIVIYPWTVPGEGVSAYSAPPTPECLTPEARVYRVECEVPEPVAGVLHAKTTEVGR